MGSKTALLAGDLGHALASEVRRCERFVDLFAGAGAVSHFVAERFATPVLSVDVQEYSRPLVGCITLRTSPAGSDLVVEWVKRAVEDVEQARSWRTLDGASRAPTLESVQAARALCATAEGAGFMTRHYGGHYFSPRQAATFDALLARLPSSEPERTLALAVVIRVASRCAAAPGHTAQPFQPSSRLMPFIAKAWSYDVARECERVLSTVGSRHAKVTGEVRVASCLEVVPDLQESDLVFCDPPYSAVQYSRFYHVLEGIARGGWPAVTGRGRSPTRDLRVASAYSMRGQAYEATSTLLRGLWDVGATVIVTFPEEQASNGLSGADIASIGRQNGFRVTTRRLESVHSTLGGPSAATAPGPRAARKTVDELLIVMRPRPAHN